MPSRRRCESWWPRYPCDLEAYPRRGHRGAEPTAPAKDRSNQLTLL